MLGDDNLVGQRLDLEEVSVPLVGFADRIGDVGAVAAALGLLQPDLGQVVVGSGIVEAADPDARHLRRARRREQPLEPGNHLLDQRQIAAFAVHCAAIGAEIVLYVDQDQSAVLRIDFFAQGAEHGVVLPSRHGFQIMASRSKGLASFCRTAISRLALRLGTLNSAVYSGRFIAATTSGFAPVYFTTKSSRSSLPALIR